MNKKALRLVNDKEMNDLLAQINTPQKTQSSNQQSKTRELAIGFLAGAILSSGVSYSPKPNKTTSSQTETQEVLHIKQMIQDRKVDVQINQLLQERIIELEGELQKYRDQFGEVSTEDTYELPKNIDEIIPNEGDMHYSDMKKKTGTI